jgi:hypothetical protein
MLQRCVSLSPSMAAIVRDAMVEQRLHLCVVFWMLLCSSCVPRLAGIVVHEA